MAEWSNCDNGSELNCSIKIESNELIDVYISKNDDVKYEDGDGEGKLRGLFDQVLMVLLRGVYGKSGSRPTPAFLGDGRKVDLFKLFCLVRERGGFQVVSENKLWGLIAEKFGVDCTLCASLKLIYYKYLDELDQWLNRLTRDRISANGSYECGGNLSLLSLELENRLRNFSIDDKGDDIQYAGSSKNINVDIKKTLILSECEEGTKLHSVVVKTAVDDREGLCNREVFARKAKASVIVEDTTSHKRKRDLFGEMLSWLTKVAKNPCHPSIGAVTGCSRGKESRYKNFGSIALSLREARLQKRYTVSIDQKSSFNQRKHKMHPSMYEDDIFSNRHSAEGLRCSERLLTSATTCQCCKSSPIQCCESSPIDKCKLKDPSEFPPENGLHKQELLNADTTKTEKVVISSIEDAPFKNYILVGPQFQAEVPLWTGIISESDSKWLGTQVWTPDLQEENCRQEIELLGKVRLQSCSCRLPGSVECYRFHIAENRMKLRRELGLAFFHWKFDRMGEEVSLSWTAEEEKRFKDVIREYKTFLGKSVFRKKTRTELVSYYFNVFLIKRRSYQNRVSPKNIDSDDDESEFGSVGEAFGYNAVKVSRSEPLKCLQNEQVFDFD